MSKRWLCFLGILAAVLLILGAVLCFVLYRYCEVYEQTRPEPVMDELMGKMSLSDWIEQARTHCTLGVSEFENAVEIYDSYIENAPLDENRMSYREDVTRSDDEKKIYTVLSGNSKVASVALVAKEDSNQGFGRHEWKVGEITSADILPLLNPVQLKIYLPEGGSPSVNGKNVSASYITGRDVPPPFTNGYEDPETVPEKFPLYDIGKLYGSVSVLDSEGRELVGQTAPDGSLCCLSQDTELLTMTLTAPEDVKVYLNGKEVPRELGTAKDVLFSDLLSYTEGQEYDFMTYSVPGFYSLPAVTGCSADGSALQPVSNHDGRVHFMHANEPETRDRFLSTVEEFFTRYTKYATSVYDAGVAGSLLNRCLRHSELYEYILASQDAMYWSRQNRTDYSEVSYDHFSMVGSSCFVCSVHYRIEQTSEGWTNTTTSQLDNVYELVFVNESGAWLCAKMESLG